MNADRELLKMAAKAAELPRSIWWFVDGIICRAGDKNITWNPLTDDGDALRLTVKLRIAVTYPEGDGSVRVWYGDVGTEPIHEHLQPDPYAATRRAIVRAAAAIGEAMP